MWRFLRRHETRPACIFCGAMPFALLAAATTGFFLGLAGAAGAQEEQLSKTGQADHSIVIREHAGWNKSCEAIAHPALYLYEPPRHGSVCARIENIKIHSMYVGTEAQCIGRLVRGVSFIYRPDPGYAGDDSLRYAAQYPSVLRMVSVTITVTPSPASAASSDVNASTPRLRQPPGPVPACEELIF
jgi:hypothetical protein